LRKTQSESFNVSDLQKRITVTDKELSFMLGVGLPTAREVADKSEAVVKIGGRKLNNVEKIKEYINRVSGKAGK